MLRLAGVRTDVEILGSEDVFLLPQVPGLTQFKGVGDRMVQPDLWAHELVTPNGETVGVLAMCVASDGASQSRRLEADAMGVLDRVYFDMNFNQERWLWNPNTEPWPDRFVVRGPGYPYGVDPQAWVGVAPETYPIGSFQDEGTTPPPLGGAVRTWEIRTSQVAGYLQMDNLGRQRWSARRAFLYQQLLPPGPDGGWHFEAMTTPPPLGPAFVTLTLDRV